MLDVHRRQVLNLLLGDAEADAIVRVDLGDGADRDGHLFLAPQVPLLQQHVGYAAGFPVDDQALDTADGAVGGVHVLAAAHLDFASRGRVVDDLHRADFRAESRHAGAEAVVGPAERLVRAIRGNAAGARDELGLLGVSSCSNSAGGHDSLTSPPEASTRSTGTSLARSSRCFGSTTRWVTARATGSTTTRHTTPQAPSLQLTSAPIVNGVVSATAILLDVVTDTRVRLLQPPA